MKGKKFFTMDVHGRRGFTLVELIVVIAVLAILAGVAVPAYSGYVTKANKQADMSLINDIENALVLAGYSGTFDNGDGGYIILSTDGIKNADDITDGSALDIALKDAFGVDYKTSLKLSYGSWGNNNIYLNLDKDAVDAIVNSSYYAVSDKLMGQVKDITSAALEILQDSTSSEGSEGSEGSDTNYRDQMKSFFEFTNDDNQTENLLEYVAKSYGYDSLESNSVTDDVFTNLLVLTVATDVQEDIGTQGGKLISDFALYNAYANSNAEFASSYATFVEALRTAGSGTNNKLTDVATAYKNLQIAATNDKDYQTYTTGEQKNTDSKTFANLMSALSAVTQGNTDMDLNNADFFTTGEGNDLFTTYMNSLGAFSGISFSDADWNTLGALDEGSVAVFFSCVGSTVYTNNSLPIT